MTTLLICLAVAVGMVLAAFGQQLALTQRYEAVPIPVRVDEKQPWM